VLPDIDHPQSFIVRVFFPVYIPLNRWAGHRGAVHSFWLWGIVVLLGWWWRPAFFVGTGAIIHILADCATVSGVRGLAPWSEKLFVIFRRSWRIKSGAPAEMIVLVIFGTLAWGGGYMGAVGGIRALIGHLTGAPGIMLEEYRSKGLTRCRLQATLRWQSGEIEKNEWLIIGTEGSRGIALQGNVNKNKVIHIPEDGKLLKARLKPTEDKWELVRLSGWARTESPVYFLDNGKWHRATAGDTVWGRVVGQGIRLVMDDAYMQAGLKN
jgi:inner membrane protein